VRMHVKPGALVRRGEPIATLLTDTPEKMERAIELVQRAIMIGSADDRPDTRLILDRIAAK